MSDLYDALGLPSDASEEAIRAAHRKLSRKHHPDTGDGDREKFDQVQRSALILRDPDKRKKYDETGETAETVDNTQAKIAEVLCTSFRKVYESRDIDYTDLISLARADIKGTMTAGATHKVEMAKAITKAEKTLKRLKFKGKGSNRIESMLLQVIRDKKKTISDTEDALEIFKAALEVLDEYEYEVDSAAPAENAYERDLQHMVNEYLYRNRGYPFTNP